MKRVNVTVWYEPRDIKASQIEDIIWLALREDVMHVEVGAEMDSDATADEFGVDIPADEMPVAANSVSKDTDTAREG